MAMVYTLFSTAKEWLAERFAQDDNDGNIEAEELAKKDEVFIFAPDFIRFSTLGCLRD